MLGSPHTRKRRRRTEPGRARVRVLYILNFLNLKQQNESSASRPTKRSAFFMLGDHFILGDIFLRTRSTTARAIICLKEIVSNTRLDLQTSTSVVFGLILI